MPIQPRGNGFQASASRDGVRYRRYFHTKEGAEEWLKKFELARLDGTPVPARKQRPKVVEIIPRQLTSDLTEITDAVEWLMMAARQLATGHQITSEEVSLPLELVDGHLRRLRARVKERRG